MSINIETDLKEILGKFAHKLDKLDRKLDDLQQDMGEVKISLAEQKKDIQCLDEKIDNTAKRLDEKIESTSERLEEKVDNLGKRLDNAEFINRGVLIGLVVAILGGAAKLFGFAGNP